MTDKNRAWETILDLTHHARRVEKGLALDDTAKISDELLAMEALAVKFRREAEALYGEAIKPKAPTPIIVGLTEDGAPEVFIYASEAERDAAAFVRGYDSTAERCNESQTAALLGMGLANMREWIINIANHQPGQKILPGTAPTQRGFVSMFIEDARIAVEVITNQKDLDAWLVSSVKAAGYELADDAEAIVGQSIALQFSELLALVEAYKYRSAALQPSNTPTPEEPSI